MTYNLKLALLGTLLIVATISQAAPPRIFGQADANKDGFVSVTEFRTLRQTNWNRVDRNNDGVLTAEDTPPFGRSFVGSIMADLKLLDANGDGAISQSEYIHGPIPAFESADTNQDGYLSRAEFNAFFEAAG